MSCIGYMLTADLNGPPARKCFYLMLCGRGPGCLGKNRTERRFTVYHVILFEFFNVLYLALYDFFWCGPFFKVFIEFVTILLLFYVFVFRLHGKWGLSSPTREAKYTSTVLESEVPTTGPQESFERYKWFKILNFFTYI